MRRMGLVLTMVVSCMIFAAGCGGETKVAVNGQIAFPAAISLKEDDSVQLVFSGDAKSAVANCKVEGKEANFTAEVPPGSYKLVVTVTAYAGHKDSDKRDAQFTTLVNKSFGKADVTKLTYQVTADANQSIRIDLDKGTVTKK